MSFPEPDRKDIRLFVEALFRYADPGGFVALRAFRDDTDGAWNPGAWSTPQVEEKGLESIIAAAAELAGACASAPERVVFAPPVATFKVANGAAEKDIANGLELCVECDENAKVARKQLEGRLGPATIIVASGGTWANPKTGTEEAKLHLHWRLTEPTREFADHVRPKEARRLAKILVGADGSAVPLVHPLRWPGSWHRKGDPKLARIAELNAENEIELGEALERLKEAAAAMPQGAKAASGAQHRPGTGSEADELDVAAALAVVPNNNLPWDEWNKIGLATWRATGGSEPGFAAFCAWSAKSPKFDAAVTRARWDHFASSPPDQIGVGTLFHMAREVRSDWVKPSDQAKQQDIGEAPPGFDDAPPAGQPAQREPLRVIDPITLQDKPVPQRQWLVRDWIPWRRVTGLYGAGGEGKTLLAQMLMTASALGQPWLGLPVQKIKVLGVFCEDDEDELHERQADINKLYDCDFTDLENMKWIARLGFDNVLMTFDNGRPRLTELFEEAQEFGAQLCIFDTISDFFSGNEIDRAQVRHFGQVALGGFARAIDGPRGRAALIPLRPASNPDPGASQDRTSRGS